MIRIDMKKLLPWLGAAALAVAAMAVPFAPMTAPAHAQTRTLPDFTDLVEQVGPSVVNIRTMEKAAPRAAAGGGNTPGEEEMLEFFKRFGVPIPNMPRQAPRPTRWRHSREPAAGS